MFSLNSIENTSGQNEDIFFKHYTAENKVSVSNLSVVKKYLFEKETFYHYEFALFNNYLRYFEYSYVINMLSIVQKYTESIQDRQEYKVEIISFYTNLSYYFLEKKSLILSEKYFCILDKMISRNIQNISVSQLLKFKFLEAVIQRKSLDPLLEESKKFGMEWLYEDFKKLQ